MGLRLQQRRSLALALALCLVAPACGQGLVDTSYRGEPLFSFQGQLQSLVGADLGKADVRLSIFWSPTGETKGVPPEKLLQQASLAVSVSFPAAFRIDIFHPPPVELLGGNRPYAVGLILLYTDAGGDGRFDAQVDTIVGGAEATALLYAPAPLPPSRSPTGIALPAGFYLTRIPLLCDPLPPPFDPNESGLPDCGVPVGKACQSAAECGAAGVCLQESGLASFPGGYCAVAETDPLLCMPRDGVLIRSGSEATGFWYQGCDESSDCARPGYVCTPALAVCLPDQPVALSIGIGFEFVEFCVSGS